MLLRKYRTINHNKPTEKFGWLYRGLFTMYEDQGFGYRISTLILHYIFKSRNQTNTLTFA